MPIQADHTTYHYNTAIQIAVEFLIYILKDCISITDPFYTNVRKNISEIYYNFDKC